MSIHQGTTSSPIRDLPLSDPRCTSDTCLAFQAAHNESQATVSYALQFQYGHWLTWYYAIWIFLAMLVHVYLFWKAAKQRSKATDEKASTVGKVVACWRYIAYRRVPGRVGVILSLPSVGMLMFLILGAVVMIVMTFAIRPYYRQHRGYGSPPLGVRTGLMAAALTPLLIALSGKANLITLLTGIGHEKLNVIHRWVGWAAFGLSVAHTIPFLVAPLKDGGYAALHVQFYKKGGFEYTGVPPLAILFGLVVCSLPVIRHRLYESFYWSHIALGIAYLGLCFWHFGNEGDSWYYLWATVAIWLVAILARTFYKNQSFQVKKSWASGFPAHMYRLVDGMTRIDVSVTQGLDWRPGQHCYVRLPGISPFDNHPFSIASAAVKDTVLKEGDDSQTMSFLVRAHSGFTSKIVKATKSRGIVPITAWIDGPYGGIRARPEAMYDQATLIAGGSGISVCLSWLHFLVQNLESSRCIVSKVVLIWIMHGHDFLEALTEDLNALKEMGETEKLEMHFFITRDHERTLPEDGSAIRDKETGESQEKNATKTVKTDGALGTCEYRRPSVAELLPVVLGSARNMVICCGPESLKIDTANAAAVAQRTVLKGEVTEVALFTESFGWG